MRFARVVFLVAGLTGLAAILPLYALEGRIGRDLPPSVTHPEFFYGFAGVAAAWQVAFLLIARDPARHRPLIPAAILEKFGFGIAVLALFARGRVGAPILGAALIDLVFGVLFIASYVRSAPGRQGPFSGLGAVRS